MGMRLKSQFRYLQKQASMTKPPQNPNISGDTVADEDELELSPELEAKMRQIANFVIDRILEEHYQNNARKKGKDRVE